MLWFLFFSSNNCRFLFQWLLNTWNFLFFDYIFINIFYLMFIWNFSSKCGRVLSQFYLFSLFFLFFFRRIDFYRSSYLEFRRLCSFKRFCRARSNCISFWFDMVRSSYNFLYREFLFYFIVLKFIYNIRIENIPNTHWKHRILHIDSCLLHLIALLSHSIS